MIDARIIKQLPAIGAGLPFHLDIHLRSEARVTVILGPSGAGKSLTLNCLAGLTRPDAGHIQVQEEVYSDSANKIHIAPEKRRCGYILQDHSLFPHMTVAGNISFALQSMPAPRPGKQEQLRRTQDLIEAFELKDLIHRRPHELSGGQRQRVSIVRALVSNPRLLLFDEPTRGLDQRLRAGFYEVLRKAKERVVAPIVIVTHDLEECYEIADTICLLSGGNVLQIGPKDDVIARPASVEVANLLGLYALLPAEILSLNPAQRTSRLQVVGQQIMGPYLPGHAAGEQGFLCVRRSELTISRQPSDGRVSQIVLPIKRAVPVIHGVRLELENLEVEVSQTQFDDLRQDCELWITIPPFAIHFLSR